MSVLLANRHACCVCQRGDVQIHHINGDNSDNEERNLAVLCLSHHNKATAPPGLTAALKPEHIREYKRDWEKACASHSMLIARSRTAFFMVDYKNAERIRQLYSQMSAAERMRAYQQLTQQFRIEDALRKQQGFDVSLEPTTALSGPLEEFLEELKGGNPHPDFFRDFQTHPRDRLYPVDFSGGIPTFAYYDLWCQIMVRAILTARGAYDLEDLAKLEDPLALRIAGRFVSFEGRLRGKVAFPDEWRKKAVSNILLECRSGSESWRSILKLKTHYVYSVTAASALSHGMENGLLIVRSIDSVQRKGSRRRIVQFSSTPLIIGSGVLQISDPVPAAGARQ